MVAPATARAFRDFTLLLVKSELFPGPSRVVKCSASSVEELAHAVQMDLALPQQLVLSLNGANAPIADLGRLPAKAKVQAWPHTKKWPQGGQAAAPVQLPPPSAPRPGADAARMAEVHARQLAITQARHRCSLTGPPTEPAKPALAALPCADGEL
jgi:hypothetical protein